jgi:general secretion pathway protein G
MIKPVSNQHGFTLIELVVTLTIVAILASVAMPMLKVTVQRSKETELRQNLQQLRLAIDAYKKAVDEGRIKKNIDQSGYPPNLEVLVEGVPDEKDPKKRKIRFLRRIPYDPMRNQNNLTEYTHDWGLRSYESEADRPFYSTDVYDVFSLSKLTGSNGVPYAQW